MYGQDAVAVMEREAVWWAARLLVFGLCASMGGSRGGSMLNGCMLDAPLPLYHQRDDGSSQAAAMISRRRLREVVRRGIGDEWKNEK